MAIQARVKWTTEDRSGVIVQNDGGSALLLRLPEGDVLTPRQARSEGIVLRLLEQTTPALETMLEQSGFSVFWCKSTPPG